MRYLFPGSFDPPTLGHMDLIERSAKLCDELVVVLLDNCAKRYRYPVERRKEMLERITAHLGNVTICHSDGMLCDMVKTLEADAVIRGIRNEQDYAYERDMAYYNAQLGDVETIFLPAKIELSVTSSSGVREIMHFGKSVKGFVPDQILDLL